MIEQALNLKPSDAFNLSVALKELQIWTSTWYKHEFVMKGGIDEEINLYL